MSLFTINQPLMSSREVLVIFRPTVNNIFLAILQALSYHLMVTLIFLLTKLYLI